MKEVSKWYTGTDGRVLEERRGEGLHNLAVLIVVVLEQRTDRDD